MARSYYLRSIDADLQINLTYSAIGKKFFALSQDSAATDVDTSNVASGAHGSFTAVTPSGFPGKSGWPTTTFTLYLYVTYAPANSTCAVYLRRVDTDGQTIDVITSNEGSYNIASNNSYSWTFSPSSWTGTAYNDRLAIEFRFYNGSGSADHFTLRTNSTYLDAPFSTDPEIFNSLDFRLELSTDLRIGSAMDEASGACYAPDRKTIAVIDDGLQMCEYDPDFNNVQSSAVNLPSSIFSDTEAIEYVGDWLTSYDYAVLDEGSTSVNTKLHLFPFSAGQTTLAAGDVTSYVLDEIPRYSGTYGGEGAEGLTYDPLQDLFYVANQSDTETDVGIWEVDLNQTNASGNPLQTRLFTYTGAGIVDGADGVPSPVSLSDLCHGSLLPEPYKLPNSLFLLTRDSTNDRRCVLQISLPDGAVLSKFQHGLAGQVEGVAFEYAEGTFRMVLVREAGSYSTTAFRYCWAERLDDIATLSDSITAVGPMQATVSETLALGSATSYPSTPSALKPLSINAVRKPSRGWLLNPDHPLSKGLVLCLPLNEATGKLAWDISNAQNRADFNGGVSWIMTSSGPALDFNGTDGYLQIGDNGTLNIKVYTLFAVIEPDDVSSAVRAIIGRGEDWANDKAQYIVRINHTSGPQTAGLWWEETDDTDWNTALSETLTTGTKYSIAFSRNSAGDVRAYLDGRVSNTASALPDPAMVDTPTLIGARRNAPSAVQDYYDGKIYLVLIYDRALTDAEVASLTNNPWQIFEPQEVLISAGQIYDDAVGESLGLATLGQSLLTVGAGVSDIFAKSSSDGGNLYAAVGLSGIVSKTDAAGSTASIIKQSQTTLNVLEGTAEDLNAQSSRSDIISLSDSNASFVVCGSSSSGQIAFTTAETSSIESAVSAISSVQMALSDNISSIAFLNVVSSDILSIQDALSSLLEIVNVVASSAAMLGDAGAGHITTSDWATSLINFTDTSDHNILTNLQVLSNVSTSESSTVVTIAVATNASTLAFAETLLDELTANSQTSLSMHLVAESSSGIVLVSGELFITIDYAKPELQALFKRPCIVVTVKRQVQ